MLLASFASGAVVVMTGETVGVIILTTGVDDSGGTDDGDGDGDGVVDVMTTPLLGCGPVMIVVGVAVVVVVGGIVVATVGVLEVVVVVVCCCSCCCCCC